MVKKLEEAGLTLGKNLFYFEDPQGSHSYLSWRQQVVNHLILFCGIRKNDIAVDSLTVEEECIPSESRPGKIYKRVNPIATLRNGVKCSVMNNVEYILPNENQVDQYGNLMCDSSFTLEYIYKTISGTKYIQCCK